MLLWTEKHPYIAHFSRDRHVAQSHCDTMTRSNMPLYQVIVLALIQAVTEFLPISSTAHLALAPWLFGWKDPGLTFDIALHAGTLLAILIYFLRDWIQIIAEG